MSLVLVSGGSGQHAFVVFEAASLSGTEVTGFVTVEDEPIPDLGGLWLGTFNQMANHKFQQPTQWIVACGSNQLRRQISEKLLVAGASLGTVVHPMAVVSPSAIIGPGSVVLAGAIVGSRATLDFGVIVNHCASIGHNCRVEDYVNICSGARLAGNVEAQAGVFVGLNASVVQGCQLGQNCIVGAGSVVTKNVKPNTTVAGVPARVLRQSGL